MSTHARCVASMTEWLNDQLGHNANCMITVEQALVRSVCYGGFSLRASRGALLTILSVNKPDVALYSTSNGLLEAFNKCGTDGMARIRDWRTITGNVYMFGFAGKLK